KSKKRGSLSPAPRLLDNPDCRLCCRHKLHRWFGRPAAEEEYVRTAAAPQKKEAATALSPLQPL
ncbi:MAG: hypothetical protein IKB97_03085, partial [Bacteroidaceae bacterium]|nr:hypothetical protein [Bacteroidaceae bacterium]